MKPPSPRSDDCGANREGEPAVGTILVVVDEPECRTVLTERLRAQGYGVMEAVTAEAALACVRRDRPDLMLLDIALPGMNGLEVLRRVRRDAPTVRIIMVTGLDDEALARSTLQMGAVDSVRVPFDFEYLDRAVRAAVIAH